GNTVVSLFSFRNPARGTEVSAISALVATQLPREAKLLGRLPYPLAKAPLSPVPFSNSDARRHPRSLRRGRIEAAERARPRPTPFRVIHGRCAVAELKLEEAPGLVN